MPGLLGKLSAPVRTNTALSSSLTQISAGVMHELGRGFLIDRPTEKSGLLLELLGGAAGGGVTATSSIEADAGLPWWLTDPPRSQPNLDILVPHAFRLLSSEISDLHIPRDDLQARARKVVNIAIAELPNKAACSGREVRDASREIVSLVSGMGPLTPLFEDKLVTDIFIDSWDSIRCLRKGRSLDTPFKFRSLDQMQIFLDILARRSGAGDRSTLFVTPEPFVSRVHALTRSTEKNTERSFEFRIPRLRNTSMYDLLRSQLLPASCAAWLSNIVSLEEISLLIIGSNGTGKTTFLNALLGAVGTDERVVSIERVAEIQSGVISNQRFLLGNNCFGGEELGTVRDLIDQAFRSVHHRVVVDDIDGAMGAYISKRLELAGCGSLVTRGGTEPASVLHSFVDEMSEYSAANKSSLYKRLSALFSLVIVLECIDGTPCLSEVLEVTGGTNSSVELLPIIRYSGEIKGKRRWELLQEDTELLNRLRDQGAELSEGSTLTRRTEPLE